MSLHGPTRKWKWLRFLALGCALCSGCSEQQSSILAGTSVVVLIDFSKSFVPLSKEDARSLMAVSKATAELADKEWQSPVEVLWSRIQTASLLSEPLCGPFQYQQSLVKRDTDQEPPIAKRLEECIKQTVEASLKSSEQAPYTDISGAIALATDQGRGTGSKYLVIVSDFLEDLPHGKQPVKFELHGEHVLLLHRMGTDRTKSALGDHLANISRWIESLRSAGAGSVVAMPLASATCQRISRALKTGSTAGTNIVILQDLPSGGKADGLKTIADTITQAARDWNSPVTITWADMGESSDSPHQMPPLELSERLIKRGDNACSSSPDEFQLFLREYATAMQRRVPGANNPDINGCINLYASAAAVDSQSIFLIVSSFPKAPTGVLSLPSRVGDMRFVMLAAPNRDDAQDQPGYLSRLSRWENWFKEQHEKVCRLPLNGLTSNSLKSCIYGH